MASQEEALRLQDITKVYSNGVMANNRVNLSVLKGEIHALSGENGAGKTTLMKILFGEESATDGDIFIRGEKVKITSPTQAIKLGIGLVHQHFMLVPSLTVAENIVLGVEPVKGIRLDTAAAVRKAKEVGEKFNLYVDPNKRVRDLTVGQMQKVEILKALLRGAEILVLDEPTAVLTPQETRELFSELKLLKEKGYTIIFISHKLGEVKELCDRITIIRRGKTVGVYSISEISEEDISRLMVGRDVALTIQKGPCKRGDPVIKIRNLRIIGESGKFAVDNISFSALRGEILGIAGVEGNGQKQLADAITRLGAYHSGTIEVLGEDISRYSVSKIRNRGLCHIPEDRMVLGIAPHLSITENVMADKAGSSEFASGLFLKKQKIAEFGKKMVQRFKILCPDPDVSVNSLSGGNIQKVVLARELSRNPSVIVANQPTRGVDVGATELIHDELIRMRDEGATVLMISSDLNEVLGMSDSLIVMFEGRIVAYFKDAADVKEEELGRYMLGIERHSDEQIQEALHE